MAGFTDTALSKKLDDLNASQQSIQTLSLWLIHHRKHHEAIVKMWARELQKGDEGRQLTLMYLANDVIQNSKKKGPEYGKEFGTVLKKAFETIGTRVHNDKTKKNINRLLDVWEERGVYSRSQIADFRRAYNPSSQEPLVVFGHAIPENLQQAISEGEKDETPPPRKKSRASNGSLSRTGSVKKEKEVEVDGHKERRVTLSPQTPAGDPPEPEELIKALQDLETSASSDAVVREKIASLPPEVSEVNLLSKLEDKAAAERLAKQVNEAVGLMAEYNTRLLNEMEDRRKLAQMLQDFKQAQKDLLAQAEATLDEYMEKLQKVKQVQKEVRSHMRNLPDITQSATSGLAPLPSAGDLFRLN
ncbi:regulation of nuclear pre-mRNA domain-containing protein 1B isoform X1 [Macrosteles quadrilineatus]|uniref:regulation of nuclear pre-mRNA domain-containing protein 1B isoform X1 n=1 Tax=Macrosteles quadrilineatus TaxID=74068 RepID=UPI0023E0BA2E|nr:regulation of nuclear pre-mRNA domain-containing protein 1B isoform X1 [Macrosteles quadrilineatus]